MSTKAAIKSIRTKITNDEPEGALYEATQLLRTIGDKDPEAANVLSFRGLALAHLDRIDEAERSYQTALKLSPGNAYAFGGLKKLYIKLRRWDDLARVQEHGVQVAFDAGDPDKVSAAMQELVQGVVRGPVDKTLRVLRVLVPSSPLVPLIQRAAVPVGEYVPFPEQVFPGDPKSAPPQVPRPIPHVYYMAGSLQLVIFLLLHVQSKLYHKTEAEVKAGRQRINAGSEKEVRRQVDADLLPGPLGTEMIDLLGDISAHPEATEEMRREAEVQEFNYWRRLVDVMGAKKKKPAQQPKPAPKKGGMIASAPPPQAPAEPANDPDAPPLFQIPEQPEVTREEACQRVNGLADGFVLLGIGGGTEAAWLWVLEGRDEPTIAYDHELLLKFAKTFPKSNMTDFIDDYARLRKLPLPEPDEEIIQPPDPETQPSGDKKPYRRSKKENARERRKARRAALKKGELSEDLTEEEREALVASMTKLLHFLPQSIFAHRVMARVAIEEGDWANAILYADKGRSLVRELEAVRGIPLPQTKLSLDEALGVALVPYYPPKHHARAARLLKGVLEAVPTNYEARFAHAQVLQAAGDWAGARKDFQQLLVQGGEDKEMVAAKEELAWCLVNEGKLAEGRDVLEEVVELRDTRKEQEGKTDEDYARARAWWRLGRTEWMIGGAEAQTQAEEWFMASLRADAGFAPSYTALGICYAEAHSPPDTERALKCFQKAFELDATETTAARNLAFGYADDDEWAQVRAIATRVMEGEGGVEGVAGGDVVNPTGRFALKNAWAWKALGSTEMHYKNYSKAIQNYQVALRAEPEDAGMWRMLGDAYVKSGRHMAGLKTLQHALELDPDMWMARYHIGETYMQLGQYDEAITAFELVDKATGSNEVGVTAALAEATLALGRLTAAGGFRERSRRAFHGAVAYALRVLTSGRSHRPWAWKVIGDAALLLAKLDVDAALVEDTAAVLHPVLEHLVGDDEDRRSAVAGLGHASNLLQTAPGPNYAIKTGVFAFAYRAHLLKNETRVADASLYDLGCALHTLAINAGDADERTAATKAAVSAIRLALERDAGEERLWNALGVICAAAGPQLAQHAFVVSLECYAKDPVVWTNLGFLYMQLDDADLANQCFLRAQVMDPDYARAWFGQAVLAQRDGHHEQAANLFAHAFTLSAGTLLEADLALALGAFGPFLTPHATDTTPLQQPAFALQHYTHSRPRDAAAKHLYALVCERLGLSDSAVSALEDAVALFEAEFEETESADVEANYACALVNLGRVRLAAGQYAAALDAFNNGAEFAAAATEPRIAALLVQARLGAGIAHFWLDDLDASLESFQGALDAAKNDRQLTDEIAVLLARTLWSVGGEDARDAAKTQLMECLEHADASVKVVAALVAVGLGSRDGDLVDAAVTELQGATAERRALQDPEGMGDVVLYAHALACGAEAGALNALENAAARKPFDAPPRNRLAKAYIASGNAPQAAILLENRIERSVPDAANADSLRGIVEKFQGSPSTTDLQRAVMLRPWDEKAWEALAWVRLAGTESGYMTP